MNDMDISGKLFLIYQLLVFAEGDRLGLVNKDEYRSMIQKMLDSIVSSQQKQGS